MPRLLIAEVRRVAARRLVRLTVALAFIGIALGGVAAFVWSDSLSEETYQQRLGDIEARRDTQEEETEACLRANGVSRGDEISDDIIHQCFPEEFVEVDDPRFRRSRLNAILQGASGGLAVVGWALGASLVGAEFASRSMTTLLTWETRRWRVFLAKTVAVIAATALFALVALALLALAMWPALALHGAPLRPNDPTLASLAGTAARGIALATLASGMGLAIATIGRNTAAALGAGFAYIIVFENIIGSFIERWRRWLLLGNVIVLVSGSTDGGGVPGRTVTTAALFLTAVAVTLLAAAASTFRTRDLA